MCYRFFKNTDEKHDLLHTQQFTHIWKTHTQSNRRSAATWLRNYNNLLNRGTAAAMIAAVQETLLLCSCCGGHQLVGDDELYDKAKSLSDHYRDIAITFLAQLLSFRACFRADCSAGLSLPICQDADCGLSLRNIHLQRGVHCPDIVSVSGNSRVIIF